MTDAFITHTYKCMSETAMHGVTTVTSEMRNLFIYEGILKASLLQNIGISSRSQNLWDCFMCSTWLHNGLHMHKHTNTHMHALRSARICILHNKSSLIKSYSYAMAAQM